MDRQQPAAEQIPVRLHGLLRVHMHIGPAFVVGAGFHQRQVKGAKTAANLGKTGEIAAVAAEEHPQLIVFNHPGTPQRAVAVGQAPARKVLGRGSRQPQAVDFRALPPVELADFVRRHAPGRQAIAHAERCDELAHLAVQRPNGGLVQMVVMIV